jgi:hypothetical protein
LEKGKKLSFSIEVAETLGLESAIILNLYQQNKLEDISSYKNLLDSVLFHISFIDISKVKDSLDKLIKFDLIQINGSKLKEDYQIRAPGKNKEINKLNNNWDPSNETREIIQMAMIPEEFYDLKLKEFKIYWIERGQQKNNWNMTFLDFIRREWAKENSSNKGLPYTIDESWYPDGDVFDILNYQK